MKKNSFFILFCSQLALIFTTFAPRKQTHTMEQEQKLKLEEQIIMMLKTVFDPEIPVDVYSLGLVYKIDLQDEGNVVIDMTLTAPNCPMADFIFEDVRQKVESIDGINTCTVNLVYEPEWDVRMMSDEAKLELGFDMD